jgi:AraC family transcriptional regulator of arabinose operon
MLSVRYLLPRPLIQAPGFSVRGVGIHETMPPSMIERPQGTGDRLIMLFYDDIDFGPRHQRWRVVGPSVVVWPSGAGHFYGERTRRWQHSWVHCDGEEITRQVVNAGLVEGQPVRLGDTSIVERLLLSIHEEVTAGDATDLVILRNLLENLVREVARGAPGPRRAVVPEPVARVKALLDSRYEQRTTLGELARLAGLSRGHLCTEFRRHYGAPPLAYLAHRRLHAAAALLRGTDEPVGEIGRQVGYPDPFYFSKHFKAMFGVPPSRLRRPNPSL